MNCERAAVNFETRIGDIFVTSNMNKIDRIAVVILAMGLALLLGYEAMDYARKTAPSVTGNTGQQASKTDTKAVPSGADSSGIKPVESKAAPITEEAGKPEREVPTDWSVFNVEEFGYQIARPANWPMKLAGNVLTIGDTEGDGHTKCYLTIEFQGSKASGQIIPAPTTHMSYEELTEGERCNATLGKIAKSGHFQ